MNKLFKKFLYDEQYLLPRCEAMSTYPRTYDFIHADGIFSLYKDK